MTLLKINSISLILLLLSFSQIKAHGYLSEKIKEKTAEISKDQKNPTLYLERGYLYQLSDHYTEAIKDYLKSEKLGLNSKLLHFRKTETYYGANKLKEASKALNICLKLDSLDVKTHKLKSKLLLKLKKYEEAKISFDYVLKNTIDLKPEDYINYCNIILLINPENYNDAIKVLDSANQKSKTPIASFELKKLHYLKESKQPKKVLNQYNKIIKSSTRKEFLYFEKAKYLSEIEDHQNSNIALQQAKLAINELNCKYQNTESIINLKTKINTLSKKLQSCSLN